MKIKDKDKTLFWLRRRLTHLERSNGIPTQEEMARMGIPYADRQKLIDQAAKDLDSKKSEIESLQNAIGFIEEIG